MTGNTPPCEVCLMPLKAWQGVSFPPPPPPQHVLTPNDIRQGASRCGHEFEGFTVWKRSWSRSLMMKLMWDSDMWNQIFTHHKLSWREVVTEHPGLRDPAESLHDTNGFLDPIFGLQFTCAWVRRRKVAIPAQPILDRQEENQREWGHLGASNKPLITVSQQYRWNIPHGSKADVMEAIWYTAPLVTIKYEMILSLLYHKL